MKKHEEYLTALTSLLTVVLRDQLDVIEQGALAIARTLENDGYVYVAGTGHSHILAEELFYRAGGLVRVIPLLDDALMMHHGAQKSSMVERMPEYAHALMQSYRMTGKDILVAASNSGRNGLIVELACLAKQVGATVIAVTNMAHASSAASRHGSGKHLHEFADIVLDNGGHIGDACIGFPDGIRVGPTSSVISIAALHAMVCGAVEEMLHKGETPEVYCSANVDGGDEINRAYFEKYRGIIRAL